jgi:hypothetical protein
VSRPALRSTQPPVQLVWGGGPFLGAKARPGRDADHSPPSSAEVVTPRPRPGERTSGTPWTGGCVGPKAGLDTEDRGKILSPLPVIEPRSPGRPGM